MNVHNRNKKPVKEHLVDRDIPYKKLFVVDDNGDKLGVMTREEALALASEKKLNLVIISTNPSQPVAKILDYGKFKYERKKKQKDLKSKQTIIENREIRLTAGIDVKDLATKAAKAREFLLKGHRVKVSLKLRGREIQRQDLGIDKLNKFYEQVADISTIQKEPTLNNKRFLDMYLVANKGTKAKKKEEVDNGKNEDKKSSSEEN